MVLAIQASISTVPTLDFAVCHRVGTLFGGHMIVDQMKKDLEDAAKLFRQYEVLHYAKGTPEGHEKARRNAEMAERLENTLREAAQC